MLFQDKFSDTVLSTVCWQRRAGSWFLVLLFIPRVLFASQGIHVISFSLLLITSFPVSTELKSSIGVLAGKQNKTKSRFQEYDDVESSSVGAWLGSQEGLFYVQWS